MQIVKGTLIVVFLGLMVLCVNSYRDPSLPQLNPKVGQDLGAKLVADWDLAQRDVRHQNVVEETERIIGARDLLAWDREYRVHRVLRSRIAELDIEIARVNASTSYSVADQEKILTALGWERAMWSVHLPY